MSQYRIKKASKSIPVITAYSRHEDYEESIAHSESDPDFDINKFRKHAGKAYKKYVNYSKTADKPVEKFKGTKPNRCTKFFRNLCCCRCRAGNSTIHIHSQTFDYWALSEQKEDEVSTVEGMSPDNNFQSTMIGENLRVRSTYEATNIGKKHKR